MKVDYELSLDEDYRKREEGDCYQEENGHPPKENDIPQNKDK